MSLFLFRIYRTYIHYFLFERIAVNCPVTHFIPPVEYCLLRIEQEGRYSCAVCNSHPDQGKDAEVGVQKFAALGHIALSGCSKVFTFFIKSGYSRRKAVSKLKNTSLSSASEGLEFA